MVFYLAYSYYVTFVKALKVTVITHTMKKVTVHCFSYFHAVCFLPFIQMDIK